MPALTRSTFADAGSTEPSGSRRGGVGPRAPPAPYIGAIYTQSTMRAQAGQGGQRGGRARPSRTGYVFYRKGPDKQAMNCGRKL